jgi:hypothetical protein
MTASELHDLGQSQSLSAECLRCPQEWEGPKSKRYAFQHALRNQHDVQVNQTTRTVYGLSYLERIEQN